MKISNEKLVVSVILGVLITIGGVDGYDSYVPLNGGFERYNQLGNPLNWTLVGLPSGDGLQTEAKLVDDARRGLKALYIGSRGNGTASASIEMPIGFPVLRMLHMETGEFYYKVLSSKGSGSNLLFELELMDKDHQPVVSIEFSPPADHVGDGEWHRHEFTIDILESRMATFMKISFSVNGREEKAPGAWIVDELQINEAPASLKIGSVRCQKALVEVGETFRVEFDLHNAGGAFFYNLHSALDLDDGIRPVDGVEKVIGVVEPGVDYVMGWDLVAERTGMYAIKIDSWSPDNETLTGEFMYAIVAAADFSHPQYRPGKARCSDFGFEVVLENSQLRLVFPATENGYGLFAAQCWNGSWLDMGISMPIGHALYLSSSGSEELLFLTPDKFDFGITPDGAWLELWGNIMDVDGVLWAASYRFDLDSESSHINVNFSVQTSGERKLIRLSGPRILAGEGSFGADRDNGLFCGLEYLLPGEYSSGTDFADPPINIRVVPHPLKVTVPLMVVEKDGGSIALSWDPVEKWDGTNQAISAKYLSPNWVQNQSNHIMTLFIPTIPDWVEENQDQAHTPYDMQGPITFSLRILARSNTSIIGTLQWWLEVNGVPEPPEKPRSYGETIDLCTKCYKDVCWVPGSKGWKHTHLDDPKWIFWDPMVAVALWHHSVLTDNSTLRDEIRNQVLEAFEATGGWGADMDLALHLGEIDKALTSGYNRAMGLVDSQREDGSWGFAPAQGKERLGEAGDTSSGWVASKARFLLKFGRITGDGEAIDAGLKAIEYLDTQERPEGAQTWELQLHVPDVLASSYIMECYLEAYRITGNPEHLEKAKYWALTGLPFIYMWNPPDRPIMRYGSIPVFGATGYSHPWFGNIVQWNGLDYAYRLYDLSRYDDSLPWRTFSEGITICGMQMQRYPGGPYEEMLGMYPDAYSAPKGDDTYYFDINPRFISLCVFALTGNDETTQTEIVNVGGQSVHFSTVGNLSNVIVIGDVFAFDTVYAEGDTSYATVGCVSKPSRITVNGRGLNETHDLSNVVEGWTYRSEGILVIKILHSTEDRVEMEGIASQPNRRVALEPVWEFNDEDAEGWANTNMLEPFTVENGVISSRSTGSDPFMVGSWVRIQARGDCVARIRMKVTAGQHAQIFWIRKDSGGYSESKSMSFQITPDGEFHIYEVKLGESIEWSNLIRQIRLDPTNAENALIEIDYIRIREPVLLLYLAGLVLFVLKRGFSD